MSIKTIKFENVSDFKSRIAGLWQDQKPGEIYDFIFPDAETKKCFDDLVSCFSKGNKGQDYG